MGGHEQVEVKVNAMCDRGIAPLVVALNEIQGVETLDSCENGGEGWGAYVFFRYGADWQALAGLMQQISTELSRGIKCGFSLRLEWFGSNDQPRGQIAISPQDIATISSQIARITPTLNARRIGSVGGK